MPRNKRATSRFLRKVVSLTLWDHSEIHPDIALRKVLKMTANLCWPRKRGESRTTKIFVNAGSQTGELGRAPSKKEPTIPIVDRRQAWRKIRYQLSGGKKNSRKIARASIKMMEHLAAAKSRHQKLFQASLAFLRNHNRSHNRMRATSAYQCCLLNKRDYMFSEKTKSVTVGIQVPRFKYKLVKIVGRRTARPRQSLEGLFHGRPLITSRDCQGVWIPLRVIDKSYHRDDPRIKKVKVYSLKDRLTSYEQKNKP